MQLVEQSAPSRGRIAIGPSLAVELSWILLAAQRDQLCAGDPALEALYRGVNGLQQRVRSFWTDGVADFGELLVLADLAHVIGSVEIDELLAGMAQAAAHSPKELALSSEDESDRAVFLQRLDRLRRSPRLRRDYARLLGELWAEVAEAWEAKGRRLVEVAAERYRHRLEQRREVVRPGHSRFGAPF